MCYKTVCHLVSSFMQGEIDILTFKGNDDIEFNFGKIGFKMLLINSIVILSFWPLNSCRCYVIRIKQWSYRRNRPDLPLGILSFITPHTRQSNIVSSVRKRERAAYIVDMLILSQLIMKLDFFLHFVIFQPRQVHLHFYYFFALIPPWLNSEHEVGGIRILTLVSNQKENVLTYITYTTLSIIAWYVRLQCVLKYNPQ